MMDILVADLYMILHTLRHFKTMTQILYYINLKPMETPNGLENIQIQIHMQKPLAVNKQKTEGILLQGYILINQIRRWLHFYL